jgi:trans-aconitate 2-methyltransferase
MTQHVASPWSPDQYARFRDERSRPFFDLLSLVRPAARARKSAGHAANTGMRIVDLGCGTGELTQVLHRELGARETIGLDSSETMLAGSGAFAGGGLRFVREDIRAFAGGTLGGEYDLVFSNAALQWVPGHETLLVRLTEQLAPGGQLAVQMPANYDHVSHATAAEVAAEGPFAEALGGYTRPNTVLSPEAYATILDRLGYQEQHVRLQVYAHHLGSRDDVVEWVKGSLLTDYQRRLPPPLYDQFLARYRARLLPRLPDTQPYFYAFKRILMWAQR